MPKDFNNENDNSRSANAKNTYRNWLLKVADVLPVAAPAAIAAFGTVAVFLLLIGQLKNELVWPLGLAAAIASAVVVFRNKAAIKSLGSKKEQNLCNVLVILSVILWGLFNVQYTAQHVFTDRDPAVYATTGAWLIEHDNIKIESPKLFADVPGVQIGRAHV